MSYDGSLKFDTKIDESGFSSGISKLGSIAKGGMAVLGTAVAGAVTAFAALTKSSLDAVASMEQNIGGIETLFGTRGAKSVEEYAQLVGQSVDYVAAEYEMLEKAQTLALDNANKAYKTAGLSANEYMETVTSFAAALKQSTASELEAAEIADQTVIDMADNANKMGSSMESIQNAYQGFAKQNYTMLDNLKLGYGGTKEEMQRLLKNAQELTGIEYDISNLSDVYSAIHVIQEDLGITGTTAAEAATTIEGSMNSAKAAWDNFLVGSISVEDFADTIGIAAGNIARNLSEIIPRLAGTVPAAAKAIFKELDTVFQENGAESIFSAGGKLVTDFVTGIANEAPSIINAGAELLDSFVVNVGEQAPQLLESGIKIGESLVNGIAQVGKSVFTVGSELIQNIATGLTENAPLIAEKASEIVSTLIVGIQTYAPNMLTSAVDLLASFVTGISSQLPSLIPQALQMVVTLADAVISNIPTIVNAGISLLVGLVQGIIQSLPALITEGPRIVNDFADAIYNGLGELLKTGLQMIASLIEGIWNNRGLLLENAGQIFMAFINIFSLSKLFSLGKSLISKLISGIQNLGSSTVSAGKWIIETLINGVKSLATHPVTTLKNIVLKALNAVKGIDWLSLGKNIISGIANGLKNSAGEIVSAAKEAASKALEAAKNFLGIHSPSRRFRDEVGKMMAQGMGIGFEDNVPVDDIGRSVDAIINKTRKRIAGIESVKTTAVGNIVKDVINNYTGETVDYKEIKKAQLEAMNEANERPIRIGSRQLRRCLKDEGVVPA